MKFKLDFGIFHKVNTAVAIALELKKYKELYDDCLTLKPEFDQCVEAVRLPFKNLAIEFRKKVAKAEKVAAETGNKLDDKWIAVIAKGADKILDITHCQDDYQRLIGLDKAAAPK